MDVTKSNLASKLINQLNLGQLGVDQFCVDFTKIADNCDSDVINFALQAAFKHETVKMENINFLQKKLISCGHYDLFLINLFSSAENGKIISNFCQNKKTLHELLSQAFQNYKIAAMILTMGNIPPAITQELMSYYKLIDCKTALYLGQGSSPDVLSQSSKVLYEIIEQQKMDNETALAFFTAVRANNNPRDAFLIKLYSSDLSTEVCQFAYKEIFANKNNKGLDKYQHIRNQFESNNCMGKQTFSSLQKLENGDCQAFATVVSHFLKTQKDIFEYYSTFVNFVETRFDDLCNLRDLNTNECILWSLICLDDSFLPRIINKFNKISSVSLKNKILNHARSMGKQDLFLSLPESFVKGCKFTKKELNIMKGESDEDLSNYSFSPVKTNPEKNMEKPKMNIPKDLPQIDDDELNSIFSSNSNNWFKLATSEKMQRRELDKINSFIETIEFHLNDDTSDDEELTKIAGLGSNTNKLILALSLLLGGFSLYQAAEKSGIDAQKIKEAYQNRELLSKAMKYLGFSERNVSENERSQNTESRYSDFLAELRRHEGFRSNRYLCPQGFPTIGYGHRILPNENLTTVTRQQAEGMLARDATNAWNSASTLLSGINIEPEAQEIVANMVYQMGQNGVRNFRNMLTALRAQDYATAADEMLDSEWARIQTPNRARELANRMRDLANNP